MKSVYFHFLEVKLAQSKNVSFIVRVVIPPPWCRVWINMNKVFLFSCIVWLRWVPIGVSCWFSANPNKFSLMKQICQANPEPASATWISSVQEHLDGLLVVLIDDHCQASTEVLAILKSCNNKVQTFQSLTFLIATHFSDFLQSFCNPFFCHLNVYNELHFLVSNTSDKRSWTRGSKTDP